CNGILHVLLERTGPQHEALKCVRDELNARCVCAMATVIRAAGVIEVKLGQRFAFSEHDKMPQTVHSLDQRIFIDTQSAIQSRCTRAVKYVTASGAADVLIEVFTPSI